MSQSIEFPAPCKPLNANARDHWAKKARATRDWRDVAGAVAIIKRVQPVERGRVIVWFSLPNKRLREVSNLQPTVKAIVDGLVDAGVFTDDNDEIVTAQDARRGPQSTDGRVWVRVEIEAA